MLNVIQQKTVFIIPQETSYNNATHIKNVLKKREGALCIYR